jgi:hypothetical protein
VTSGEREGRWLNLHARFLFLEAAGSQQSRGGGGKEGGTGAGVRDSAEDGHDSLGRVGGSTPAWGSVEV